MKANRGHWKQWKHIYVSIAKHINVLQWKQGFVSIAKRGKKSLRFD